MTNPDSTSSCEQQPKKHPEGINNIKNSAPSFQPPPNITFYCLAVKKQTPNTQASVKHFCCTCKCTTGKEWCAPLFCRDQHGFPRLPDTMSCPHLHQQHQGLMLGSCRRQDHKCPQTHIVNKSWPSTSNFHPVTNFIWSKKRYQLQLAENHVLATMRPQAKEEKKKKKPHSLTLPM